MAKRFLWDLTRKEVMKGVKAFIHATDLKAGSIGDSYDLYSAALREWQRAKARRLSHG